MKLPKDALLEDHPGQLQYKERRAYMLTVKQIFQDFTENMNISRPGAAPIKLLDYVINNVVDLMIKADAKLKKTHEPNYMIISSESESETSNANWISSYKATIEEYLGIGPKQSSWHKALVQARVKNNSNFA